jgi:PAS domain S-box-containing protein
MRQSSLAATSIPFSDRLDRPDPAQIHALAKWTAGVAVFLVISAIWAFTSPQEPIVLPWFVPTKELLCILAGLAIAVSASSYYRARRWAYPLFIKLGFVSASILSVSHLLTFPGLFPGLAFATTPSLSGYYILSIYLVLGGFLIVAATWGEAHTVDATHARRWTLAVVVLTVAFVVLLRLWEDRLPVLIAADGRRTPAVHWLAFVDALLAAAAVAAHWRAFRRTRDALMGYVALAASLGLLWTIGLIMPAARHSPFWYVNHTIRVLEYVVLLFGLLSGYFWLYRAATRSEEALLESESRLAGIVGLAMDAIVTIDAEQRITLFNRAAEEMFRCPAAEAVGRPIGGFIPERFREAHAEHVCAFGRTGLTSRSMREQRTVVGLRADGEEFPVEASISRLEAGEQKLYTVILRDVTARKQAEREIRALTDGLERRVAERTAQLELANRELEAFSYSVSHDLRAPLRSIDGFSQALLAEYTDRLDAQGRDWLRRVRAATQRMAQLIDDLLSLSRVTRSELRRERVDLSAMARAFAAELQRAQPDRRVTFAIADGLVVDGDSRLLRVAVENLLDNAWKFTAKHPEARVEFGVAQQDGTRAYFVRDDGAGFDMAYAGKLFVPFQRLHGVAEFEGTGVGLATVQRIVHRHGGRVWAEGAVERGATFYFTL